MPFTGFGLKYPEYEVITPQTKQSFTIRTLNVQEEERLKGSMVTPQKVTDHLNKCIYEALVMKPDPIKDYDTFLKSITLKDRDALLYGLYHVTYEDIRNYDVRCTTCRKTYPVTVKASSTFNIIPYPADDVLQKKVRVPLPVSAGVTVIVKQPTLADELYLVKTLTPIGQATDIVTEIMVIDSFEQNIETEKTPKVFKDPQDIRDAYYSLPARDKRAIHNAYMEEFGKYGIQLKMRASCIYCNDDSEIDIDLVDNFFRMVFGAR